MPREEGRYFAEDFFVNTGGLVTSDSPFIIKGDKAVGGQNFDYTQRGAFKKRLGHTILNGTPNSQLKTIGLGLWDVPGSNKAVIRDAGTKIQAFDTSAITFTNLSEDTTAAGTDFLSSSSIVPVVSSMFNTPNSGVLWQAGGGLSTLYGVYSATKVTANGVATPTGAITATVTTGSAGQWPAVGAYYYAVGLYKASTGAISNAGLDITATVVNVTDTVTIHLSSLSSIDTTKYTKLYLYRSAVGGVSGFTVGSIAAEINISSGVPSTYADEGLNVVITTNVPRPFDLIEDNSPLPSGTYTTVCTWNQRLVTSSNSNLYISDVNKPESWPSENYITIPSGGPITGLATINNISAFTGVSTEFLVIFKQREVWILAGTDYTNFSLQLVDNSGCPNQSLIVSANAYLYWLSYRGIFVWDGNAKPIYLSQPIEDQFQPGGTIDKSKLSQGFGIFCQARNEVQWYLSNTASATSQTYCLKLDLRLTLQAEQSDFIQRKVSGIFTPDTNLQPIYAGMSALLSATSTDELIFLGDNTGTLYQGFTSESDMGQSYTMQYTTPYLDFGNVGRAKRYAKLILWVLNNGVDNINLSFWTDYKYADNNGSQLIQPVSPNADSNGLIWDVGKWDVQSWDTTQDQIKPLIFNLNSSVGNNTEGDSIRFTISQTGNSQSVVIYGFTVLYNDIGLRK